MHVRDLSKCIKIHSPQKVTANLKSYQTIQPITKSKANTSRFYKKNQTLSLQKTASCSFRLYLPV